MNFFTRKDLLCAAKKWVYVFFFLRKYCTRQDGTRINRINFGYGLDKRNHVSGPWCTLCHDENKIIKNYYLTFCKWSEIVTNWMWNATGWMSPVAIIVLSKSISVRFDSTNILSQQIHWTLYVLYFGCSLPITHRQGDMANILLFKFIDSLRRRKCILRIHIVANGHH